jgi:hypothetical protein
VGRITGFCPEPVRTRSRIEPGLPSTQHAG